MLDGEIWNDDDILQGVAQGYALSLNLFQAYINTDMMVANVAFGAAKRGVTVGEDTVSGLMSGDDFVGISETPEISQKQLGKALAYTRKRSDSERKQTRIICMSRR